MKPQAWFLLILLGAAPAWASREPVLELVRVTGEVGVRWSGHDLTVDAGAGTFAISPGTQLRVFSGEATLRSGLVIIKAKAGTALSYAFVGEKPVLAVITGAAKVFWEPDVVTYHAAGEEIAFPDLEGPPPPAPPPTLVEIRKRQKGRRWPFKLSTSYGLTQVYDTNVFLTPGGAMDSWTTTGDLGFALSYPLGRWNLLSFSYGLGGTYYNGRITRKSFASQNMSLGYRYQPRHDISLNISDAYVNTALPPTNELTNQEQRWENTLSLELAVERSRGLAYTLDVRHSLDKFVGAASGALLNHYDLNLGGSVGVKIQPRTKVYVDYHRELTHFTAGRPADAKGHALGLGISGVLTPKINGRVQGGYNYREQNSTGGTQLVRTWVAGVSLDYQMSRRTSASFSLNRRFNVAVFGASSVGTRASLSLNRRYRRLSIFGAGSLEVDQFTQPASVASGLFGNRRDDLYQAEVGAQYPLLTRLFLTSSYSHVQRHSLFTAQFNYKVDRYSVGLKGTF
ncbi:MAG: outer membrane beta-barrel protein [Elusimicrobia bacterium]|nr:outer membrane beta-barrel protein [Elusimicrobiota bacterium]